MGVKGLQQYIDETCPEIISRVSLHKISKEYHKQHEKNPLVIIDGLGCLRKFYGCLDWVYGGQWKQYVQEVKLFIDAFHKARIDIMFVFDGSVDKVKRAVWVKRRKQNRKEVVKVFNVIKDTQKQPSYKQFIIPVSLGTFSHFLLSQVLNQNVLVSVGEADRLIFEESMHHDCYGVLGQDSDFLIYDCGKYLSLQSLVVNSACSSSVKIYDREKLASRLNIPVTYFPVLACLLGNDILSRTKLRIFHRKLLGLPQNGFRSITATALVPKVAKFIKENMTQGQYLYTIQIISKVVFECTELQETFINAVFSYLPNDFVEKIQEEQLHVKLTSTPKELSHVSPKEKHMSCTDGVFKQRQYSVVPTADNEVLLEAQERHRNSMQMPLIYNILTGNEVDSGVSLEDDSNIDIPSSSLVYRPIRQRLFGLLLNVKKETDSDTIIAQDPCIVASGFSKVTSKHAVRQTKNPTGEMPQNSAAVCCSLVTANTASSETEQLESVGAIQRAGTLTSGEYKAEYQSSLVLGVNAVKEWCVYAGNALKEADIIEALPINVTSCDNTPSLSSLWFGNDTALRWNTFKACMLCDIPTSQLQHLPMKHVALCCVLHFLLKQKPYTMLFEYEVDAFIGQAVSPIGDDLTKLKTLQASAIEEFDYLKSLVVMGTRLT